MKIGFVIVMFLLAIGTITVSKHAGKWQIQPVGFVRKMRRTWFLSLLVGILIAPVFIEGLPTELLLTLSGPLALVAASLAFVCMPLVLLAFRDEDFPRADLRVNLTLGVRLLGATVSGLLVMIAVRLNGSLVR